jgi:uncharacterized protein with ParB-like and HNH nuclease domain
MQSQSIEQKIRILETEVNKERKKISTDRLDISYGELINLYKNKELIIQPEYQRLYRWSVKQKTAFIESILLSIPIPPIFVAENTNDGVWELVDGLQRLTTFISFFGELDKNLSEISYIPIGVDEEIELGNEAEFKVKIGNKWVLEAGSLLKTLDGFNIDTFPRNFQINLKRAVCRVEIVRGDSSNSMKYELFKRLNSGGSKATAQEIRNAIFRGIDVRFNELLIQLSQHPAFLKLTELSETKKQELYDQELVLRFMAFYNNAEKVNENMEKHLDDFMEKAVKNEKFDFNKYKNLFLEVLELIDSLGNPKIFRNNKNYFVPSEFEGITIGIAQNIDIYRNNIELLGQKIATLKSDKEFKNFSGTASSSKNRTKNRLKRANQIFSLQSNSTYDK